MSFNGETAQINNNGISLGTVTFDDTGSATLTYTPNGGDKPQDTIVAQYSGDTTNNGTSATLALLVQDPNKVTPNFVITATPNPAIVGQPVTLTFTLTEPS